MGICTDRPVNYLKTLNLNTILQPQEDLAPLQLFGEYGGARAIIGTLTQLVNGGDELPQLTSGVAANIIGAMGGNLGVNASYQIAKKIQFSFADVTRLRAHTIAIGDYLEAAEIRWEHPVLNKFLFGSGKLYVITEIVTSREIGVTAFQSNNTAVKLEVPVIQAAVGGSVSVGAEAQSTTTIMYEGAKDLAFGFKAIELSAGERGDDGEIDLVFRPVRAGDVSFSVLGGGFTPAAFEGALQGLETRDPALLGEG